MRPRRVLPGVLTVWCAIAAGCALKGAGSFAARGLMIDLIDARTGALASRGWALGGIDGASDDQRWFDQVVDRAVTRILDRLPKRP